MFGILLRQDLLIYLKVSSLKTGTWTASLWRAQNQKKKFLQFRVVKNIQNVLNSCFKTTDPCVRLNLSAKSEVLSLSPQPDTLLTAQI